MAHKWQFSHAACLSAAEAGYPSQSENCIANSRESAEIAWGFLWIQSQWECNFRMKGRQMTMRARMIYLARAISAASLG